MLLKLKVNKRWCLVSVVNKMSQYQYCIKKEVCDGTVFFDKKEQDACKMRTMNAKEEL